MSRPTHDELVHFLSLRSSDASNWCLEHPQEAERLTSHAVREFRAASCLDLVAILGMAVHVANRVSVDQALADMGGAQC